MKEEELNNYIVTGLVILILLTGIYTVSTLNEQKYIWQKNPISQTRASDEFKSYNFTLENEGLEIRETIGNETEIQAWSANGTELIYRGKIENYSGVQYEIRINKSMVDSLQIREVNS